MRHPLVAEIVEAYDRDAKIARGLSARIDRWAAARPTAMRKPDISIDLAVEAGDWPKRPRFAAS